MPVATSFHIRAMTPQDWPVVAHIYQEGMATQIATFETELPTYETWDQRHLPLGRAVCEHQNFVIGWVALSPASHREVYRGVAEISIYITHHFAGQGAGTALMRHVIGTSEAAGIWTLQAGIFPENEASLALHRKMGFRTIGFRERVAQRNGQWHNNILLERRSTKI